MEQNYLSDDVFEQIKDFNRRKLTKQQKLLIDKLILNEDLKIRYFYHGLCKECKQPNTGYKWCQSSVEHYQQNFKNWTSENSDVDKFIQESQINAKNHNEKLEWIEYDKFENIEYITKGGFGTIYKANWKDKPSILWSEANQSVALKSLNNSKNITLEFLNEINLHLKMNGDISIIRIYGITKDPKTSNFMMVMDYADNGNLRQTLNSVFNSLSWFYKLDILQDIAYGLNVIHRERLTHRDFHSANEKDDKVYGVLPYVAPEVLRGKKYTQESDVYSFGIIIYEVINGLPPYYDIPHDEFLVLKICQGLRPSFNIKVPQLIVDLFKQCVDAIPSKRPTANYLQKIFRQWWSDIDDDIDSEIYKQKSIEPIDFTKLNINPQDTGKYYDDGHTKDESQKVTTTLYLCLENLTAAILDEN
ncbi:kinase-like domain-containing protein [Glomus cerebriforme]|uniref:Kinase-like domain-containing protein n=1 Tax=Glomus cerebriforme TaxID=658196 RepID=A0A397SVP0_9GLOM|nr:kinase-like domain-containing protein [Glomus cerebriforme]